MDPRRRLLGHSHLQAALVVVIVVLSNLAAAKTFFRVDLTEERLYSLDLATRQLAGRLERPLTAKVYFSRGLAAPYNNHEQLLVDKLEDLRAYSQGWMDIQVVDPATDPDHVEEARRYGIEPIPYRFRSANLAEMKQVYMGVALVYGDRQEILPAVTVVESLEYDLARALKRLVAEEGPRTIGWTVNHGEPNLFEGTGPLERIRNALGEEYKLVPVELGGAGPISEEIDALYVVGPQKPLGERAQYQIDQMLMRGGSVALFLTGTRPDLRTLRPQGVFHGLDALVGSYGVQINHDLVVDRTKNGVMNFPARQGKAIVQVPVNYPLIPKATEIAASHPAVRGLNELTFPFAASLTVDPDLPAEREATVLAATGETGGRIKGVKTLDPAAFQMVAPGEERGKQALLVALKGELPSFFANKDIPRALVEGQPAEPDDPTSKIRQSAPTRLVVAGSADFVANNIGFMLNLTDWLVEDEALIGIRSKAIRLPPLEAPPPERVTAIKLVNLLGGSVILLLFAGVRSLLRRRAGGAR